MKKPSEILTTAREILSDPKSWAQGYYAKTREGHDREALAKDATCFCMVGALAKAAGVNTDVNDACYTDVETPEITYLVKSTGEKHIPNFNDDGARTHAEVIEAFDKAIKLAQSEGN